MSEGRESICKGFNVVIHCHTPALLEKTPEDIRFIIGDALEQVRLSILEEVDFTLEVTRRYSNE